MKMTAELSVYPLREDFKTAVLGFIEELLKGQDVVAVTNSMSTQVSGEDEAVFRAIQAALRASYEATAHTQVEKLLSKHFPQLDEPRAELDALADHMETHLDVSALLACAAPVA